MQRPACPWMPFTPSIGCSRAKITTPVTVSFIAGKQKLACSLTGKGASPEIRISFQRAAAWSNAACWAGLGGTAGAVVTKRTSMVKLLGGGAEAVTLKVTGGRAPDVAETTWVGAFPSRQAPSRA